MSDRIARRVLLVGWSGADWQVIHPLVDSGQMPHLEGILDAGVLGPMGTLEPQVSSLLWTSATTGKLAHKHGVFSQVEPDESGSSVRPVTGRSRQCPAIWDILSRNGIPSSVVGWPTVEAEQVDGVFVSELATHGGKSADEESAAPPGTIYPAELADELSALLVHPSELTPADLLPFIPQLQKHKSVEGPAIDFLASTLAEWSGLHAIATSIMESQSWQFMTVVYDAIDRISHAFMDYHPPRRESVAPAQFATYQGVVNAAYRFSDMMLGRLLELAGPETTVLLFSEHGFQTGSGRPASGNPGRNNTRWHRKEGVFVMVGPGVRSDEYIWGPGLLDVAPTVLHLFGLPVGDDMDGRPLLQALESADPSETIPSWDSESKEDSRPTDDQSQAETYAAALARLEHQGYFDVGELAQDDACQRAEETICANRASVQLLVGQVEQAAHLLEHLVERYPTKVEHALALARAYQQLGRKNDCRRVVERVLPFVQNHAHALHMLGSLAYAEGDWQQAISYSLQSEQAGAASADLHCQIGEAYLHLQQWAEAERAFNKALQADHQSARAYSGLTVVHLSQQRYRVAKDMALTAIGIRRHVAMDHYHLGVAFANSDEPQRAALALEASLELKPNLVPAHELLAELYQTALSDESKAEMHRQFAAQEAGGESP